MKKSRAHYGDHMGLHEVMDDAEGRVYFKCWDEHVADRFRELGDRRDTGDARCAAQVQVRAEKAATEAHRR